MAKSVSFPIVRHERQLQTGMKQRRAEVTESADATAADENAGTVSVLRKRKKRRLILQEITDGPDGVLEKRSDVVRALQARRKAVRQPELPSQITDVEVKPKVRVLSPTNDEMDKLSTQLSSAKLRARPSTSYVGELVTKINGQKHGAW